MDLSEKSIKPSGSKKINNIKKKMKNHQHQKNQKKKKKKN